MSIAIDNQFLDINELSRVLRMSTRTIERNLKENPESLPPSVKFGRKRLWHKQVIANWIGQLLAIQTSQVETGKPKPRSLGNDLLGGPR